MEEELLYYFLIATGILILAVVFPEVISAINKHITKSKKHQQKFKENWRNK